MSVRHVGGYTNKSKVLLLTLASNDVTITLALLDLQRQDTKKKLFCVVLIPILKKSGCSGDLVHLPKVEYPDIVNYLVLRTSWHLKLK